jgi:hypothetical protein
MVSYNPCPAWVSKIRGNKQGFREGYEEGYQQALQIHKDISKENNKKELPIFLNLNIIIEKRKTREDAEDYVKNKFEKIGY